VINCELLHHEVWRQRRAIEVNTGAALSVSHARRLLARVARSLLERADLLVGRARLRVAWAG
jgi:hypothetical protein